MKRTSPLKVVLAIYVFMINTIAYPSMKINKRIRNAIVRATVLLITLQCAARCLSGQIKEWLQYEDDLFVRITVVLFFILLFFSADRTIKKEDVKLNRSFWIGWLTCFLMILLTAQFNTVREDYLLWAVISLLFFGPFAIIWSQREDYIMLCKTMCLSGAVSAIVFLCATILLLPLIGNNNHVFWGIAANPNSNGMVCTSGCISLLFLYLAYKKRKPLLVLYMGMLIGLVLASNSRTSLLAIMIGLFLSASYSFREAKQNGTTDRLLRIGVPIVMVVIVAILTDKLLLAINQLDLRAYSLTDISSGNYTSNSGNIIDKLDRISSGRIAIWKAFLNQVTFWGNGSPQEPLIEGYHPSLFAHNNVIEILYTSGFFAAAGYIVWLCATIRYVAGLFSKAKDYNLLDNLIMLTVAAYFITAMLEVQLLPMTNTIFFMLYICMIPVAVEESPSLGLVGSKNITQRTDRMVVNEK